VVESSVPVTAPATVPEIYLIFSGHGAQWAGMGKELLKDEFLRMDLERMNSILQRVEHPPSWSIIGLFSHL
jgi:acyl transferase domain-containing protein